MKYLSIFVLAVFINFTALPSIAVIFHWEIPTLNNNISEEEVKNNLSNYNEKFPPKPYNFKDFMGVFFSDNTSNAHILKDDSIHLSPFKSIFSPPPEV